MKHKTKLLLKSIIAVIVLVALIVATKYYQPVIGGNLAVEQLKDSYSSNTGVKIWREFKNYWVFFYIAFIVLLFANDVKKCFEDK